MIAELRRRSRGYLLSLALLGWRFVVRSLWLGALRTALSVAAVALGIAAVVAVLLANQSAIASFQQSVTEISGRANLSVTSVLPFDEDVLARVYQALDSRNIAADVTPVLEQTAIEPASNEAIELLAVDLVADRQVRDTRIEGLDNVRDAISVLADPAAIVVGAGFAARHGLRPGSALQLIIDERPRDFVVRGILAGTGPGAVLNGNLAVLDIAAGQALFARAGKLDRIELYVPPEDRKAAHDALAAVLPAGVTLQRPQARGEQMERMLRAFRLNLTALSLVSLLVGALLIYNSLAVSALRRRAEVGSLRALGAGRALIVLLFLGEALLVGVLGGAAGILLGAVLARRTLALVAGAVATMWSAFPATPLALPWHTAALAMALAAGIAVVSALGPAWDACRVNPADALRRGAHEQERAMRKGRSAIAGLGVLGGAAVLARLPAVEGLPLFGYGAAVLLVLGGALLMPVATAAVARLFSAVFTRRGAVTGMLAARSLRGSLARASVLAMALATAVAMMASVAIMVYSFRHTVDVWAEQTLRADLFVRSRVSRPGVSEAGIRPESIAAIQSAPGVRAVDPFRSVEITYRGDTAVLASNDWNVLARYGRLLFVDGRPAPEVLRPPAAGAAVVNEPFAIRYHVSAGDTVVLPTPSGDRRFQVRGVYYDYSRDRGAALIDRAEWLRVGGDPGANGVAVYLNPGVNPDVARAGIQRRLPGRTLLIALNRDLRSAVLRVFDRTFAITWVLEAIAICVAVLGIANALLALVLERRRELAVLRYVGVSRPQMHRIVVTESALLGLLGCSAGLVLGLALSLILIYVINRQSFGWTIQFALPVRLLGWSLLGIFVTTCLAAIYPARKAARMDAIETLLVE